ncbi:FadR/GntR family transcriptional regulator [Salinisphaera sp.]|uniref:FadR/GntR family transcriptional regulator n=1 Tax=Salinisphaera sp. TaxID=1914330 RepID=UPI002D7A1678|nr:FadR/GntR family transcriptional regulator [Salinisphaera sp.]HET7314110.1 FadR/GntR family transcriptional regulator [Salinisphaera sp.]
MTHSANQLKPGLDLARQMAQQLSQAIHGGVFGPGQRLPTEVVLGQQYGTSRSVVREALSMLRQSGLIISRRGSGSFVANTPTAELRLKLPHRSFQSVIELLELRRAVEVEAARLAAIRRTPSQLRRIRNAMVDIDEAVENGATGVEQDMAFHHSIAKAANNTYFTASVNFYNQFLQHAITVTRTNEAQRLTFMEQVVAEHQAILNAITAGDAEAAARCVAIHLTQAEKRLREAPADLFDQTEDNPTSAPN